MIDTNQYVEEIMNFLRSKNLVNIGEDYQIYSLKHKAAFASVYLELFGDVPESAIEHDTDKLVMYGMFPKNEVTPIHTAVIPHHYPQCMSSINTMMDCIVDYECARFTKEDKPLNAYDTIMKFHPETMNEFSTILKSCGLGPEYKNDYNIKIGKEIPEEVYNKLVEGTKKYIDFYFDNLYVKTDKVRTIA